MKPLTSDSFKPDKIRAVSSDKKSVDNLSYTSIKFEFDGDKMPPLRTDGTSRIFKFKNSKEQFILYQLIAMNLWKNSSMNYKRLLQTKLVNWFPRS